MLENYLIKSNMVDGCYLEFNKSPLLLTDKRHAEAQRKLTISYRVIW